VNIGCVEMDARPSSTIGTAVRISAVPPELERRLRPPAGWFDYLFVTGASSSGSCYSNPNLDKVIAAADAAPLTQSPTD